MKKVTRYGRCQRCGENVDLDRMYNSKLVTMISAGILDPISGVIEGKYKYFVCYECLQRILGEMKYKDRMFTTIISEEE